ncbi:hypothetical protein ACFX13_038662 [Malus domestica]
MAPSDLSRVGSFDVPLWLCTGNPHRPGSFVVGQIETVETEKNRVVSYGLPLPKLMKPRRAQMPKAVFKTPFSTVWLMVERLIKQHLEK